MRKQISLATIIVATLLCAEANAQGPLNIKINTQAPNEPCTPGAFCVRLILPAQSGSRGESYKLSLDGSFIINGFETANSGNLRTIPGDYLLLTTDSKNTVQYANITLSDFSYRSSELNAYTHKRGSCNITFPSGTLNKEFDIKVISDKSGYICQLSN